MLSVRHCRSLAWTPRRLLEGTQPVAVRLPVHQMHVQGGPLAIDLAALRVAPSVTCRSR
ncbi:hypothetical protein SBA3_2780033 [Candidatus Sulfopaludibacter sp. SbA3]|nr:hypothetical protein SBA3_2780033 [Candidatus Sulfopaludibacter sp. SbA3]